MKEKAISLVLVCWTLPILYSSVLSAALAAETAPRNKPVTPVIGESWLDHLHSAYSDSSMGKTWGLGPLSRSNPSFLLHSPSRSQHSELWVTVHGADLYRFNCQGCHGPSGLGAPPEVASLIDPVRATSPALVAQRMKNAGAALSRKQISDMTNQARAALLKRLHEGGKAMPSFQHLSEPEIRSLVAYLQLLAGVPDTEHRQNPIQETPDRVGEMVAKSTCHVCHGATGANPTTEELLQGNIPPLSALPFRVSRAQMAQKVTSGAAVPMNSAEEPFRGRMPVFDYLAPDEVSDVYEYLDRYPPGETDDPNIVSDAAVATTGSTLYRGRPTVAESASLEQSPDLVQSRATRETAPFVFPLPFASVFALLLFALGGWITAAEFAKLNARSNLPSVTRIAIPISPVRFPTETDVGQETVDATGSSPDSEIRERKIS